MVDAVQNTRQIGALIIGRWFALIMTFLVPVVLVRVLNRDNYGLYCQFNTVSLFMVTIFSFAIGSNLYYFVPRSENEQIAIALKNAWFALLSMGGGCVILLQIPFVKELLISKPLQKYSLLIGFNILLMIPATMTEAVFISMKHKKISMFYPGMEQFVRCLILVIFAVVSSALWGVLAGITLAHVIIFFISSSYIFYCIFKNPGKKKFDFLLLKKQVHYSLPIGFSNIVNTMFLYFDKLLCIHFISSSEYALYAVAFMGIPGVTQIIQSFSDVYLLNISKAFGEGKKNMAVVYLKEMEVKTFSFSLPIVLAVVLWAEEIITLLFSEKYAGSVLYFQIYVFTLSFSVVSSGKIASASGKSSYHLYSNGIVAVLMLPLIYFLVKNYGAFGGVIGATTTQFFQRIILAVMEMLYLHESVWNFFPWKKCCYILILSVILLLPWCMIRYLFHPGWIVGGLCSLAYLISVAAVEIHFGLFLIPMEKFKEIYSKSRILGFTKL